MIGRDEFNKAAGNYAAGIEPGDDREIDKHLNSFAPNASLTGPKAAELAAIESRPGSSLIHRLGIGPDEREAKERRERDEFADALVEHVLRSLTAQQWDEQLVSIGGMQMTNAQAQQARLRILDNPDHYIRWALQQGLIETGQEHDFIDTVRRMHELAQVERENGKLTPEQAREREQLQGSALGRAADQATAQSARDRGLSSDMNVEQSGSAMGDTHNTVQRYEATRTALGNGPPDQHEPGLFPSAGRITTRPTQW